VVIVVSMGVKMEGERTQIPGLPPGVLIDFVAAERSV